MISTLFWLARPGLVMLGLLATALPVHADNAAMERLQAWLVEVQTLEGQFDQQLLDASGEVVAESNGTLALQRPGLFRWHYTTPSELLVVSDGKQVYSYDVELENVTVMAQDSALSGSPAALLAGTASVTERFTAGASWQVEGAEWVELLPRDGERDFQAVRLALDGENLVAMELHDQLGQVTRVKFSGLQRNVDVDAGKFAFDIPEGVDVIEGGEMSP